jgi:putative methyltransferase (TIGR04325 family)
VNKDIKRIIRPLIPEWFRRILSGFYYGWHGHYKTWHDALQDSTGYNSSEILDKVTTAAISVKEGEAAFERDSVIFHNNQYSYELMSMLMWIASRNKGKLNVLDFGGSLGSTYFQNKNFLDGVPQCNWCVVEQPAFTEVGKRIFASERLHFFYSIEECIQNYSIDVALFSSVLQYLEKPFDIINQIDMSKINYIIVDRTPFINDPDRITLQRVPPSIYKASYPCWFFNRKNFLEKIQVNYHLKFQFKSLDRSNLRSEFLGMLFSRK